MMQLNEIEFPGTPPVDSYGPGFFRIEGKLISGHVVLLPSGYQIWSGWDELEPIVAHAETYDVLFFGTGADIAHVPVPAKERLLSAGIAFEPMNTPAACRTYNVLLSENRRVAAALIAV